MGAIAARVTKIERERAKARARRRPRTRVIEAPGSLVDFVPMLDERLFAPEHLRPIAEAIEQSMTECVEACFSVPPRHGKTRILHAAIVWILSQDPTATILYASYAHGFAAKQVRAAMKLAVKAGIALGDERRRDEWTTAEGGRVKAVGVDGQITGEGFRWIFVDDPHKNRGEAESRRIREGVVTGFLDDIYSRQEQPWTSVFVVHTRWVTDDLIGSLTAATSEDSEVPPFRLINLPAINSRGEPLAPRLFDVSRLHKLRTRLGEYSWASLYMGAPRPKGGLLFSDVTLIDELEEGGAYKWAIGVDLAHTARTRSDWNCACVMRKNTATGAIDVVEVIRHQGTLTDRVEGRGDEPQVDDGFIRKLHALSARYPGAPMMMFAAKDETLIVGLAGRHDKFPVRIRVEIADSDKWRRAQPYATAWNDPRGVVRVLRKAPWMSTFVREHVSFTGAKGERDDQVDAAAAAFSLLQSNSGPRGRARGTGEGSQAARFGGIAA